jgi:hypothetical protein
MGRFKRPFKSAADKETPRAYLADRGRVIRALSARVPRLAHPKSSDRRTCARITAVARPIPWPRRAIVPVPAE